MQAQFEGQLAHDQGVLAQSQVDLVRYQKLAEQNSIARQQYRMKSTSCSRTRTRRSSTRRRSISRGSTSFTAGSIAVTGRIGLRLVDPGNYIDTTNTTGIAVATQRSRSR